MDFDARFKNWVRWCKARGMHKGRVGSAEGGFRSPRVGELEPRPPAIDVVDAQVVNKAFAEIPGNYRRVIKVIYFREHWRPQWMAQKLGCHMTELPKLGYDARMVLKGRIDFIESRTHNSVRSTPFSRPLAGAPA